MDTEAENQSPQPTTSALPTTSPIVLDSVNLRCNRRYDNATICTHHHGGSSTRNIEIDWREMDPYFSELSDCASFWTLINFTCDVIYSGLFVLFFIMGQDAESMFFEGLLNHINPILIYLILSLIINYGALRSLRSGREKCFLAFSVSKSLLFPITLSLLIFLVFCDVQDYFGTFWVSFVVIVSCYNLTAVLGLWSMFTCNKYILVNEAAQKRIRKQAKLQRSTNNELDCQCGCANLTPASFVPPPTQCGSNHCASSSRNTSSNTRKVADSSCANNVILLYKHDNTNTIKATSSASGSKSTGNRQFAGHTSAADERCNNPGYRIGVSNSKSESSYDDIISLSEDDDVLQISTVHKMMQEIRLLENGKADGDDNKTVDSDQQTLDDGYL